MSLVIRSTMILQCGDNVKEYRPETWFECDSAAILKTLTPFFVGRQACVGRNLATLELHIIIASILKRFHFVLEKPEEPLQVRGFLEKTVRMSCWFEKA